MKIRRDFVTNSSSSSYIICFARIADAEKAQKIIDKHDLKYDIYDSDGVREESYFGDVGADWAGATIHVDSVIEKYPDDKFLILRECIEAEYDEYGDPVYDYDFDLKDIMKDLTKENGFDNFDYAEGEGRDG